MNELALPRSIAAVIEEYDLKVSQIKETIAAFEAAGNDLKNASTVGGTWGNTTLDVGSVWDSTMAASLLKSAWQHIYDGLNIKRIASAADKRRFDQAMASPAPFTMDNIRATFGHFIADPRANILRGLAEVFCDLDQAYKSHDKVKIGVSGLPKRIILTNVGGYSSWGRDRLENVLNALASYQGKPLVSHGEMEAILTDGTALKSGGVHKKYNRKTYEYEDAPTPARGVTLKRFGNGNGHLIFEPDTLRDINMALAEYYGDVLADCSDDKPTEKQASTAVSKDLQYYPTPVKVVKLVMDDIYNIKGERVLEPSCGCGRFLDAIRAAGGKAYGIEVDTKRAAESKNKGHNVYCGNFLETVPTGDFDRVIMNPPFYGLHYVKHVQHAMKFLKPGGVLTAILPVTARYDHQLLDGKWSDLPVGSFSESGTNINTTVLTIRKEQ